MSVRPATMSVLFTWSDRCPHCLLTRGFSCSITLLSSPLSDSLLERSRRLFLAVLSAEKRGGKSPLILPFRPLFNHFHLFLLSVIHNQHLQQEEYLLVFVIVMDGQDMRLGSFPNVYCMYCISLLKVSATINRRLLNINLLMSAK